MSCVTRHRWSIGTALMLFLLLLHLMVLVGCSAKVDATKDNETKKVLAPKESQTRQGYSSDGPSSTSGMMASSAQQGPSLMTPDTTTSHLQKTQSTTLSTTVTDVMTNTIQVNDITTTTTTSATGEQTTTAHGEGNYDSSSYTQSFNSDNTTANGDTPLISSSINGATTSVPGKLASTASSINDTTPVPVQLDYTNTSTSSNSSLTNFYPNSSFSSSSDSTYSSSSTSSYQPFSSDFSSPVSSSERVMTEMPSELGDDGDDGGGGISGGPAVAVALAFGVIIGVSCIMVVSFVSVRLCLGYWSRMEYSNLDQDNIAFGL